MIPIEFPVYSVCHGDGTPWIWHIGSNPPSIALFHDDAQRWSMSIVLRQRGSGGKAFRNVSELKAWLDDLQGCEMIIWNLNGSGWIDDPKLVSDRVIPFGEFMDDLDEQLAGTIA